jgi:hypothetical protein
LLDEVPTQLSVSSKGVVFALGESGKGYLFLEMIKSVSAETSSKKKKKVARIVPVKAVTTLEFTAASGSIIPILAANFPEFQDRLDVAWGNALKPTCEQVQFTDANGDMISSISLDRQLASLLSSNENSSFTTVFITLLTSSYLKHKNMPRLRIHLSHLSNKPHLLPYPSRQR